MQSGIWAAGVDLDSGKIVRPVTCDAGLPHWLESRQDGPLAVGYVVDIGTADLTGRPPHIDDLRVAVGDMKHIEKPAANQLVKHLEKDAVDAPLGAFGAELQQIDRAAHGLEIGHGARSLSYWACEEDVQLWTNREGRPRLRFEAGGQEFDMSATDRLFEDDLKTPSLVKMRRLRNLLATAGAPIVCLGVGRPYPTDTGVMKPWPQVNNIYPVDEPFWGP